MRIIILTALAVALAGCTVPPNHPRGMDAVYRNVGDVDLAAATNYAVGQLIAHTRRAPSPDQPILVSTLADVSNLDASSPFGRIVSEHVASSLVEMGYMVPEVKLRRSMLIRSDSGEFMLSRDARLLAPTHNAQAVVLGTYAAAGQAVNVSLRMVSLGDGMIVGAYDFTLPVGPSTYALLR